MDAKRLIALLSAAYLLVGEFIAPAYAATPLINCSGSNVALQSTANPPTYSCATISSGSGNLTTFSSGNLTPLFNTSVANPTSTPALSFSLINQNANLIFAGPGSGLAASPSFRALVGSDLPNPSVSTLGGVEAYNSVAHQWINAISSLGVPSSSQPAFTDISGIASAAQGGTGLNSGTAANGNLLIGNGTGFTLAPLTAGTNINIVNSAGGITISSSGGSSVSVTSSTPDVVVNPSPGTGTFTVGAASPINAQGATTPYTIQSSDMAKTLTHSRSSNVAVTLPQAGTTGFGVGSSYGELNLGIGPVTITPTASTLNGNSSQIIHQYGWYFPISDPSNNWSALGFPGFGTITTNAVTKFIDASGAWTASSLIDNGTTISTGETITFTGSSSGSAVLGVAAAAGTGTKFQLPSSNGTSGYVLQTDGTGVTSWQAVTGTGTVTTASVVTANGFAGTVANATTTPAITLTTSVTGILKGNGTAISAATSGTDYAPATSGSAILKGNGSGGFSSATSGTDYAPATSGSSILKGNGSGGFSSATAGTDYAGLASANTFTGIQTCNTSSGICEYIQQGAVESSVGSNGNSGTSKAINIDNGNFQSVTITGAVAMTLTTPTHPGKTLLVVTEDASGHVYSISGCKWAGGTALTYSTAANKIDVISIAYDGTNFYCMGGAAFN